MGWDVVEIGLKHNLPINDPFATAQEIAKRMKQNVRLVYENKYEYDNANIIVRYVDSYEFIELGKFEVNSSQDYLQMTVADYQANQIVGSVGIEKLRKATFVGEFADLIIDDLEEPFELYEIEDKKESLDIRIFKENVDLDVFVIERWHTWEDAFYSSNQEDRDWLRNYRMQIYNRAKMFGCQEVIICSDQGPTMEIFDRMNYTSDDLKEYAQSFQYLKDSTWIEEWEKEGWKKDAKHIMFSDYFQNKLDFASGESIDVVFDDFSDIETR